MRLFKHVQNHFKSAFCRNKKVLGILFLGVIGIDQASAGGVPLWDKWSCVHELTYQLDPLTDDKIKSRVKQVRELGTFKKGPKWLQFKILVRLEKLYG